MDTIVKVIFVLLGLAVGFWLGYPLGYHSGSKQQRVLKEVEYIHHRDTVVAEIPVPKVVVREIPAEVDTAAILSKFYEEVHYTDTVRFASFLFSFDDMISQNRLVNRVIKVDGFQPVVYRNALVISAIMGRNMCSFMAGIRHKRWTWQAGYDFANRGLMVGLTKEVYRW